uniref:serine hydrolase domain-containing protein n=1 Tax=Polaribacter sp. TaxID=1920175 RepID=UPI003F6A7061
MKIYISIIILFSTTILFSQENELSKIDSILNAKVKLNEPGIAVGIIKEGNVIYEKYLGLSNLQHQVKFDKKTRSNIASTAKQFTALMILDLKLNKKLSLEDDIRKYLPKVYKNVAQKIKVRHLLNHTSGVRDYVELLDLEGDVWWQRFGLDNEDILELIQNQEELGFKPGTHYSYSNTNYILLTKIIEEISGKNFNEYSKIFFENLGMKETSFVEKYMSVI